MVVSHLGFDQPSFDLGIDDDDDEEVDDAVVVEESQENNNDEPEYNYNHVVYQDSQGYDSENLSLEDLFDNDGLTQDSCFEVSSKENRKFIANRTEPLNEVENGAFGESQNEEAMKSRVNEIQNEGVEEVKSEDLKCVFDLNEVPIEGLQEVQHVDHKGTCDLNEVPHD